MRVFWKTKAFEGMNPRKHPLFLYNILFSICQAFSHFPHGSHQVERAVAPRLKKWLTRRLSFRIIEAVSNLYSRLVNRTVRLFW